MFSNCHKLKNQSSKKIDLKRNQTRGNEPHGEIMVSAQSLVKQLESGGRIILPKTADLNASDIILEAARTLKRKGFVVCHTNFKGSKDSREFLRRLHAAYYSGFFPKQLDLEKYKSNQLKKMMQEYEMLNDSGPLFVRPSKKVFDFSEKDWSTSIDLVGKLAKRFKKKTVVFLENFDVLITFKDSLKLQEHLRSCMQHHDLVSYCFSVGSMKREIEIFHFYKAPFYLTASRLIVSKDKS
jgi:hypothetical protein